MAIRVRKLARQLRTTPVALLGILKAIGFDRYQSPEDMLSGPVELKLRTAIKDGVKPAVVEPIRMRKKPIAQQAAPTGGLFPDVVREVDGRFETLPTAQKKPAPHVPPLAVGSPDPIPPDPTASAMREVVVAERATVEAERAAVEAERAAVDAERRALDAERAALAAERAAWEARARTPSGTTLADVLRDRGLIGVDESERAIRALAEARRIGELLPYLSVADPEGLQRWLRDVLVLVDGPPPEALGNEAMVSVASERAEIPGAAAWRRLATTLSEKLLLNGARRVIVVGGSARAHRLLRQGMDPRIDLRFRPGGRVVGPDAEADVTRTDAVALWGVEEDERARETYDTGRAVVARIDASNVRSFVEEWVRALAI